MSTAYELLPTTGDQTLDRDINNVNRLIESHVSPLGLDDEQIKSALEGRYGSAVQESVESFQSVDKDFVTSLDKVRETIESLTLGTKRNRELAATIDKQTEIRRDLINRLSRIAERLEG